MTRERQETANNLEEKKENERGEIKNKVATWQEAENEDIEDKHVRPSDQRVEGSTIWCLSPHPTSRPTHPISSLSHTHAGWQQCSDHQCVKFNLPEHKNEVTQDRPTAASMEKTEEGPVENTTWFIHEHKPWSSRKTKSKNQLKDSGVWKHPGETCGAFRDTHTNRIVWDRKKICFSVNSQLQPLWNRSVRMSCCAEPDNVICLVLKCSQSLCCSPAVYTFTSSVRLGQWQTEVKRGYKKKKTLPSLKIHTLEV